MTDELEPAARSPRKTRYQKDKERGPNQPCGEVDCPICGTVAPVFKRRDRVGRKYYNCPKCGQNYCVKDSAQKWLQENMRAIAAPEEPQTAPEPPPVEVKEENDFLGAARKFIIGD